jgi:tRNA-2-methylthio-N6-dimethylallyladenosine synthase
MQKKFFIKTFGCQMNVADTERMAALLSDSGYGPAEEVKDADVILLNGCSVREKAVHKAVSALGRLQKLRTSEGKKPIIGVGGCVGQLEKGSLFQGAPYLDFVFGTDVIDQLPEIVHQAERGKKHLVYTEFDRSQNYSTETKLFQQKSQAYVNIMKGCDKYCTYCIVPFTRGKEKSRTIDEVVADVARLVGMGVKEVTLLGQNVNSFGKGNPNFGTREPRELKNPIGKVGPREGEENFPQLLRALDTDPRLVELKRIRFTSSHPLDFSDELIDCYAPVEKGGVGKLARQLHLPVQSGSNRILQKMGRHHKIETYKEQMTRLRELCPDVGLSTDLIVGFPGETEEDFQETLTLLRDLQYDQVYAFAYSPRPGTRAEKLEDDVSKDEKSRRLNALLNLQEEISNSQHGLRIGHDMDVLVETEAKNAKMVKEMTVTGRVWTGRTSCNRIVHFQATKSRDFTGKMMKVRIESVTPLALYGKLTQDPVFAELRA